MATQRCPECKKVFVAEAGGRLTGLRCPACVSHPRMSRVKPAGIRRAEARPRRATTQPDVNTAPTVDMAPDTRPEVPPTAIETSAVETDEIVQAVMRKFGPYEFVSEIGRGGMGLVMKARDESLKRDVAIKILLPKARKNPTQEKRFVQEAQISGQLEHPGIVPVHLLGHDDAGNSYFSMKLVTGLSFAEILEQWHGGDAEIRAEYPLPRLLSIFERVCETLVFAHSHQVIHRDLKPTNVMIGEFGEVWVLDWGLAKVLGNDETQKPAPAAKKSTAGKSLHEIESNLTMDGVIVGTPGYMAPEQVAGETIDEGVDIFGLGGLLYEILCGRPPISGETVDQILNNTLRNRVAPIPKKVHGQIIPRPLAAIARKCLETERHERYASAADLLRDLRAYANGEPINALREGPADRIKRFARRHSRTLAWVAGVGTLMLLVVVAAAVWVWRTEVKSAETDRQKNIAEQAQLQAELDKKTVLAASAEKSARRIKAFEPYTEAMDLLMRGQLPERAASLLRDALAIDPEFEEAQYALGEALRSSGLPGEAGVAYLKADQLSRKLFGKPNVKALVTAGLTFDDAEFYTQAEEAFAAADRDGANDALAVVGRILMAAHTRRLKPALELAEGAVNVAPHLWETHFARGYILLSALDDGILPGQVTIDSAIEEFQQALELAPRQAIVCSWLALAGTRVAKFKEAMVLSDRSISLEPKNANRYFHRWMIERKLNLREQTAKDWADAKRLGLDSLHQMYAEAMDAAADDAPNYDPQKAYALFGKLLSGSPDWPAFVNYWAVLGIRLHHDAEVRPVVERFVARRPEYYGGHYLMALLTQKSNPEAALREVDEGLRCAPYQWQLYSLRVDLLMEAGRINEALASSEKTTELAVQNFFGWQKKALILAKLNRHPEAAATLQYIQKTFADRSNDLKMLAAALERARNAKP